MSIENYINKKLKEDKEFRKEYYKIDLNYDVGQMITEVRMFKGLTQKELADLVGTKQSSIARAENCKTLPSLSFLKRIADAVGVELIPPRFSFMEDKYHNLRRIKEEEFKVKK